MTTNNVTIETVNSSFNASISSSQKRQTIEHNFRILSQYGLKNYSDFKIVHEKKDPTQDIVQLKGRVERFFSLFSFHSTIEQDLRNLIQKDISELNAHPDWLSAQDHSYTPLFMAAQKTIQTIIAQCSTSEEMQKIDKSLFLDELSPFVALEPKQTMMDGIPDDQKAFVRQEGWFWKHAAYYYNEADAAINHQLEGIRILIPTQIERIKSLAGKTIEFCAKCFGQEVHYFKKFHYFSKDEDKNFDLIYSKNSPLANVKYPLSYNNGHATQLLRVFATSSSGKGVPVNVMTDPHTHDINKILYPRMTKPGQTIDKCPAVHVVLLSHNHKDHLDIETLKELLPQQPIILLPKGDRELLIGFKNVIEHEWWQNTTIPFKRLDMLEETFNLSITAVPANHWSGRSLTDNNRSTCVGYVIHNDKKTGDIYFAGDTALLSEAHNETLRTRFNIKAAFQPAGPNEPRIEMQSTHQSSADVLLMHVKLQLKKLYESRSWTTKDEWIEQANELQTICVHDKAFKLGTQHFGDTEKSFERIYSALLEDSNSTKISSLLKPHEQFVCDELKKLVKTMPFWEGPLTPQELVSIFREGIINPKIGQLCPTGANITV